MVGLRSVRRDARGEKWSLWRVIVRSALYHGAFNFVPFCVSAWNGNVGWIHPTGFGSNVVMFGLGLALQWLLVYDIWRTLERIGLRACS